MTQVKQYKQTRKEYNKTQKKTVKIPPETDNKKKIIMLNAYKVWRVLRSDFKRFQNLEAAAE